MLCNLFWSSSDSKGTLKVAHSGPHSIISKKKDSTILKVASHLITKPKKSCWFRLHIWFQRLFWVWIFIIPSFFNKYSRQDFLHPFFIISSIPRFFLNTSFWEEGLPLTFLKHTYATSIITVGVEFDLYVEHPNK